MLVPHEYKYCVLGTQVCAPVLPKGIKLHEEYQEYKNLKTKRMEQKEAMNGH